MGVDKVLALSDVLRFDFVTNETTNGTLAGTSYGQHYEVSHFTETLTKVPGNGTVSFTIRALNADNDLNFVGDSSGETAVSGLMVTITNGSGGAAPSVVENPRTHIWTITGADLGDTFTVNATTDAFSAIEITGGVGVFTVGPAKFFSANAVTPFRSDTDHRERRRRRSDWWRCQRRACRRPPPTKAHLATKLSPRQPQSQRCWAKMGTTP